MSDQNITRKLRAILSADVKGYSLLMSDDEVLTLKTLDEYKGVMSELIQDHSGRVVDSVGDNLLAEFSSAVDAVECAIKIQDRLKSENAKFVDERKIEFRVGINIGDVIHDGDRIIGEGVNIASRIESLADAGGISISRNTYDHIKNKLNIETKYLGEHQVKNIQDPVRVYKVLIGEDGYTPLVEEKLELPDKPSIAVLPFTNMSGDPSQEYFSDGLTEQIINGLCKVSNLFVIARNSSFAYKGKAVSIKQVAQELGVKYILEGSVQRAGDRVRITAQLIDALSDFHMWSETYDRNLEDIFALQDEITMKVISKMEVKIIFGEQAQLWEGLLPNNINAYDNCMRSVEHYHHFTKQDTIKAISFAEKAISLDNNYAFAHAFLGLSLWLQLFSNWSESPLENLQRMEECGNKALSITDSLDMTYILLGLTQLIHRNHEKAIEYIERAVEINPNGSGALSALAFVLVWSGYPEEAIKKSKLAIRFNPIPQRGYYISLGIGYRMTGQVKKAIKIYQKMIIDNPDSLIGYLGMTVSQSFLGQNDKAKYYANKVLEIDPTYSIDRCIAVSPFKYKNDLDKILDAFRKAGIPEHPPE